MEIWWPSSQYVQLCDNASHQNLREISPWQTTESPWFCPWTVPAVLHLQDVQHQPAVASGGRRLLSEEVTHLAVYPFQEQENQGLVKLVEFPLVPELFPE